MKKSWKLSDLKEYHTAPPYAIDDNKRNAKKFRGRRRRRFGLGGRTEPGGGGRGGVLRVVGRGAAVVGDTGDVWTLGIIGGGVED